MADDFFTPVAKGSGDDFFTPSTPSSPTDLRSGAPRPAALDRPFGLPAIPSPIDVAVKAQHGLGELAAIPFRLAGKLDVAAGNKTPKQAESRAQTYGNFSRDLAEGAALPWTKLTALGRTLMSGGLGAVQSGLEKGDLTDAAKGAVGGLAAGALGEGVRSGVRAGMNTSIYKSLSGKVGETISTLLGEQAPALKGMSAHDIAFGKGPEAVETAWKSAKGAIPSDLMIEVPEALAKSAGISAEAGPSQRLLNQYGAEVLRRAGMSVPDAAAPGMVKVPVRVLVGAINGLEGSDKSEAWRLIDAATENIPQLQNARTLMRLQRGWQELAERGKLFDGKTLRPEALQDAVTGKLYPKTLMPRGMGYVKDAVESAIPERISVTNVSPWTKKLIGAIAGGGLGHVLGLPGWAAAAPGALAAEYAVPSRIYGNLPTQTWETTIPRLVNPVANATAQQVK